MPPADSAGINSAALAKATCNEVLVFGCRDDDCAVLLHALGPEGPLLRTTATATEFAQRAISRPPLALVLGVGMPMIAHLDMIALIRAVRSSLPVIVIADDDSLELERRVREKNIFYYLVSPIDKTEVKAVLRDVARFKRG